MKNISKSGSKSKKESKGSQYVQNHGAGVGGGVRYKDDRLEQLQADHEHFLQAFEKPTQIYRYLRTRAMISPIFLNRTLIFMKTRLQPRNNHKRLRGFKVDSLLEKKLKESQVSLLSIKSFMTLTFLGFYDKKRDRPLDRVNVEVLLVGKGRKSKAADSNGDHSCLGTCEVPVNPSEDHPPSKAPALSIPSKSFSVSGGLHAMERSLVIRVSSPSSSSQSLPNGTSDTLSSSSRSSDSSSTNGQQQQQQQQQPQGDENQEPSSKRRKLQQRGQNEELRLASRELNIYDKSARCLMTEGEYEVLLTDCKASSSTEADGGKPSAWESTLDFFAVAPTLKFRLSWGDEAASAMVENPRPLMPRDNVQDASSLRKDRTNGCRKEKANGSVSVIGGGGGKQLQGGKQCLEKFCGQSGGGGGRQPRILYQFLYNNNSRQQTEAKEDLRCPWCCLSCNEMYALLKHLKLSHPRFLFTYLPIQEGARIDVSVSELFDSTYVGNPNDMMSQPPGFAFSRRGPVQRTPITNILVCKPKRTAPSLSEFLEIEENDLNGPYVGGQRPFVTGHNRLYHYSTTNLPMPPCAILQPSTEDEVDPPWLMKKICRMIDEFSDVNEGEKELMKMWNLHVQHYTFVGDRQMGLALKMFVEEKGHELLEKKLYRNFLLHLSNLFEFGVLGPGHVFTAVSRLQQFIHDRGLHPQLHHWSVAADRAAKREEKAAAAAAAGASPRKDFSGIFRSSEDKKDGNSTADGNSVEPCLKVVLEKDNKFTVTDPANNTATSIKSSAEDEESRKKSSTVKEGKTDDRK